jgi:P-type Mg2+ transporter
VVRTRRRLMTTAPSATLAIATASAVLTALALPFTPIADALGFGVVHARFVAAMGTIVVSYIAAAEVAKRCFYRLPLFRA